MIMIVVYIHHGECLTAATFLDELRQYAMKLHTREQAPKEGKASAPKNQKPVGFLSIELIPAFLL